MKEYVQIAVTGALIVSGLVGALLIFFMGTHLLLGSILLGVPLCALFGGLAVK
jgi:hypothetical protein